MRLLGISTARLRRTDRQTNSAMRKPRAADDGDPGGFWGIGKVNEQRKDWTAAAASYRKGADLGDAACAYGLGVSLYELGDRDGSG